MTPDMIRQLPAGHALIIRGGYAPVIARLGAAWKDRAYKTARRRGAAVRSTHHGGAPSVPDETPAARTDRCPPPRLTIVPDGEARNRPGRARRQRLPVELTAMAEPEGLAAALLQLSAHAEKLPPWTTARPVTPPRAATGSRH